MYLGDPFPDTLRRFSRVHVVTVRRLTLKRDEVSRTWHSSHIVFLALLRLFQKGNGDPLLTF
nr:MAG: hypothetical protein AM324_06235 [Candidatus Thorarchaeota archaeon SMTZ1-83]